MQKLSVNKFEGLKILFNTFQDFIKNYNEESDEGYFLEVDIQYPEKLLELRNDLTFLPKNDWY